MTRSQKAIEAYFSDLREALGPAHRRAADEIQSDTEARIRASAAGGTEPEAAAKAALEDLGNPFELAHRIRGTRAPTGSPRESQMRWAALALLVAWSFLVAWSVRSWSYGWEGSAGAMLAILIHAPFALLLAPHVIWRWNWLFVPAVFFIALGATSVISVGGQEVSGEHMLLQEHLVSGTAPDAIPGSVPGPIPGPILDDGSERRRRMALGLAIFGLGSAVIIAAMQQRRQRQIALAALTALVLTIEIPYRLEERSLREDITRVTQELESLKTPWDEGTGELIARTFDLRFRGSSERYSLSRARSLAPSAGFTFDSQTETIEAHD